MPQARARARRRLAGLRWLGRGRGFFLGGDDGREGVARPARIVHDGP